MSRPRVGTGTVRALGWAAASLTLLSTVLSGACSDAGARAADPRSAPASREPLRPVILPDLAQVDPAVRAQLREGHAALARVREAQGARGDLARAYGDLGKLLMSARFGAFAEPCLLNAQALAAEDSRWPYLLGHVYMARGAQSQALAAFQRALDLNPNDVPTLIVLGEMRLAAGHADAAAPLFSKALETTNGRLAAQVGLGRVALARRDFRSAVDHLEKALSLAPKALSAHYPLAQAYRGLGDEARAEIHARLAGESELSPIDPLMDEVRSLLHSAVSYELSGTRALNQGDWRHAMDLFRKGLALEPANAALKHKLGTALFLSGDVAAAQTAFEQVTRESPEFAKAHFSLGMMLAEQGRTREAERRLAEAIARDPGYVEAHVSLAELLRQSGRLRESVASYDRALAIDPRIQEAALGRALTLVRLRRYAAAVDRLNAARVLHPAAPWLTHALARVLAAAPDDRLRDGPQAVALMSGLSHDDQRLDFGETMAMALAEAGRLEEAVTWQRRAMELARQAGRADLVPMIERLRLYESGRPSRTPWRPEELQ